MAIMMKMTYHAQVERIDRLVACIEHLGVGEVVLETEFNDARVRLTSTGLCLVMDKYEDKLITGYMCPINRCTAIYRSSGYTRVPESIYKTVTRNNKKYKFLLEM